MARAKGSRASVDRQAVDEESLDDMIEDEASDEESDDFDADFAASWNYFERIEDPPAGSLASLKSVGPRPGMTFPPQNPDVQRQLLKYFQDNGIEATVEPRPVRYRAPAARSSTVTKSISKGDVAAAEGRSTASGSCGDSNVSKKARGRGGNSPASPGSRAPRSPGPSGSRSDLRASAEEFSLGGTGKVSTALGGTGKLSTAHTSSRPMGSTKAAEEWAQFSAMHRSENDVPPPVSFMELGRWRKDLMFKSRAHGQELSKRCFKDCGDLRIYHNRVHRTAAAAHAKDGGAAVSLPLWSSTSCSSFHRRRSPPRNSTRSRTLPAMASSQSSTVAAQALRRKAESLSRCGPSRLQILAAETGVSTVTGFARHRDRDDWLYASSVQ